MGRVVGKALGSMSNDLLTIQGDDLGFMTDEILPVEGE